MTNLLVGLIAGIACRPWWTGFLFVIIACTAIGIYRVMAAVKSIKSDTVNDKTTRSARTILLVCGKKDSPENALNLAISRDIPPITAGSYCRSVIYEAVPALILCGVVVGIRIAIR